MSVIFTLRPLTTHQLQLQLPRECKSPKQNTKNKYNISIHYPTKKIIWNKRVYALVPEFPVMTTSGILDDDIILYGMETT